MMKPVKVTIKMSNGITRGGGNKVKLRQKHVDTREAHDMVGLCTLC